MQLLLRVFSLFPNGPPLSVSFELVSGGGINAATAASLFPFPNGPPLSVSFELVSGGGINAAAAASLFPFS